MQTKSLPWRAPTHVSPNAHIRQILQDHKPIVSEVFKALRGFDTVAYHYPVFDDGDFQGTVSVLIPFDGLSKKYLDGIKLSPKGHAWLISRKGTELYGPVPGHLGKSVFDSYKDSPDLLAMFRSMVQGQQGATSYVAGTAREEAVQPVKEHAVYLPVRLGDTF
jgi:two-component system cell cycle sensor histidine kinase/response regulator CckA